VLDARVVVARTGDVAFSSMSDPEPFVVYDVPRCSTARKVLALLAEEAPGVPVTRLDYHRTGITRGELVDILGKAGLAPADVLRTREAVAQELGLPGERSDEELLALMAEHPRLVQRPLVVRGDRALLARPVERVRELF
jgi:arsenate reductase